LFYELQNGQWDRPELRRRLAGVRADAPFDDFKIECSIQGLGPRVFSLSGRRLEQPYNTERPTLLTMRDITERTQLEEDLKKRLLELAEGDRSKNEFLAMLAHELRNPLAPIRNALQVLQAGHLSAEETHWSFEMMERQIFNMTRLIDDLLDISRISHGQIRVVREPLELAPLLKR